MLKGKTAIITGAGSGIGLAIVKTFAHNGANIKAVLHHFNDEIIQVMEGVSKETRVSIDIYEMEMIDEASVNKTLKEIIKATDKIDILVNCAGIPSAKTLGMTSPSEMEMAMKINFIVPSCIMQMVSRKMIRQKSGIIINIASRAGIECRTGVYAYGSSKAALIWGTKAAAKELASFGIRVNGIAPGLTETKMGSLSRTEESISDYVSANNIKRPAKVEEIADVALFLVSDRSSYISGQIISVDGGRD